MRTEEMNANYSLTTIFCDDIRHEINGKVSLMGMYRGEMFVPDFPITLPKICAFFELRLPPDFSTRTDAIITVMKGAEKLNSITLNLSPSDVKPLARHGKPYVFISTVGGLEFPSMTLSEPTLLEVIAQIDGQSVTGGRLWVTTFPQNEGVELKTAPRKQGKRIRNAAKTTPTSRKPALTT
jgi:hypothetical protein